MDENFEGVLILGAGMAGLAAARALAERGVHVLMLEARARVGGRVLTHTTAEGDVIELGAEFVHGRPPELWALIDEAGLQTTERKGAMLRLGETGAGLHEDPDTEEGDLFGSLDKLAELEKDMPFAEWLAGSHVPEEQRQALTGYVEGFNAADAGRISARSLGIQQRAEDANDGDRVWHIHGGYAQVATYLGTRVRALGGEVRFGCEAVAVRWQPGRVEVELGDGERISAPKCVITLPLGVLLGEPVACGVRFEPEPRALLHARRLVMGSVVRYTLVFREAWWSASPCTDNVSLQTIRSLSFLFTSGERTPVWWTAHPETEPRPTLTGWVGGPRAAALAGLSAEELGHEAVRSLGRVFGIGEDRIRDALVSVYVHDWNADPFARGAYSYVPAGALDASAAMAKPEAGTLFFAGEHTDTSGHWGTVHAALRTGLRAAAQALGEAELA